ncbi:BRI1 kinase inhibitor 1-like [Vigna unguiculata]|uniref:BRI1 kinase inhibitor 1-like n=1 Tax=Vigna unguiculata TaxID=3917 RepID=UPI0010170B1A|nr:BRI1 kinase inhibitor 1-like [Vigna unguiculata]
METHQHQIEAAPAQLSWQQENREEEEEEEASSSPQSSTPSSPSQEFSFTISLHHTFPQDNNSKAQPSSIALDLSPADDIFFHGHLLPLHLLSHLPSSPRSSTNSMESFTLPITGLLEHQNHPIIKDSSSSSSNSTTLDSTSNNNNMGKNKVQGKSKFTFSLFGLAKGHKGCRDSKEDKVKQKKKVRFDVIHAIKKYLRMVQPKMLFKGEREKKIRPSCGQSYSYSGNVTPRNYKQSWREQYSAPASMRTSPTNSGLLIATTTPLPSSARDSTMEELQAAIQAAIAHCKNSISKEEKLKC